MTAAVTAPSATLTRICVPGGASSTERSTSGSPAYESDNVRVIRLQPASPFELGYIRLIRFELQLLVYQLFLPLAFNKSQQKKNKLYM